MRHRVLPLLAVAAMLVGAAPPAAPYTEFRPVGGDPGGAAERALRASGVPESYPIDRRERIVRHAARDIGPGDGRVILALARRAR